MLRSVLGPALAPRRHSTPILTAENRVRQDYKHRRPWAGTVNSDRSVIASLKPLPRPGRFQVRSKYLAINRLIAHYLSLKIVSGNARSRHLFSPPSHRAMQRAPIEVEGLSVIIGNRERSACGNDFAAWQGLSIAAFGVEWKTFDCLHDLS